ncbi:MAG TPA: hypothetical protein VMM57_04965 [Bacteroidota bacterium]|nr:hypothetical protein [Bacteroidota bacterium]
MKSWWFMRGAKFLLFAVVAVAVLGFVTMLLWNALVPDIFHGSTITFWQGVGLLILSHILLRGWGRWRYGNGWKHDRWRRRFEEKLAAMTPEEREKFREEWKRRCGSYPDETPEQKAAAKA